MAKRRANKSKDTDDKIEDSVSATSSTKIMEQYLLLPGESLITDTPFSLVNDLALKTSSDANHSGECTHQLKPKLAFPILTPPNSTDHNTTLELNSECAEQVKFTHNIHQQDLELSIDTDSLSSPLSYGLGKLYVSKPAFAWSTVMLDNIVYYCTSGNFCGYLISQFEFRDSSTNFNENIVFFGFSSF